MSEKAFTFEPLHLPDFKVPQKEHETTGISWERAMEEFEVARCHYMENFDSPERRFREKNPKRFHLH